MKHILVAVDFSDASHRAVDAAAALARDLKADLVLVHAFTDVPGVPDVGGSPAIDPVAATKLEVSIDEALELSTVWADDLRKQGFEVQTIAREGRPADIVIAAADEVDAALIVVGTAGRKGWRRFVLGSVAENIVRRATRPVLVVPGGQD